MQSLLVVLSSVAIALLSLIAQALEASIPRDAIWVSTVQDGTMPVREPVKATVVSTSRPAVIAIELSRERAAVLKVGMPALVKIGGQRLSGRLTTLKDNGTQDQVHGTIEVDALPDGTVPGASPSVSVEYDSISDTLFVERPAQIRAGANANVFKVYDQLATQVRVRFGRAGGDLIEIREGLQAGDRVITSDTSAWATYPRALIR
jgi:hypothetical protein